VTEYPIKRPIEETPCEQCGALLHVGDCGVYVNDLVFCSEGCADEMQAHNDGLALQWNDPSDL
jgi:hypothetical protein